MKDSTAKVSSSSLEEGSVSLICGEGFCWASGCWQRVDKIPVRAQSKALRVGFIKDLAGAAIGTWTDDRALAGMDSHPAIIAEISRLTDRFNHVEMASQRFCLPLVIRTSRVGLTCSPEQCNFPRRHCTMDVSSVDLLGGCVEQ